jgi:hypothetical protein
LKATQSRRHAPLGSIVLALKLEPTEQRRSVRVAHIVLREKERFLCRVPPGGTTTRAGRRAARFAQAATGAWRAQHTIVSKFVQPDTTVHLAQNGLSSIPVLPVPSRRGQLLVGGLSAWTARQVTHAPARRCRPGQRCVNQAIIVVAGRISRILSSLRMDDQARAHRVATVWVGRLLRPHAQLVTIVRVGRLLSPRDCAAQVTFVMVVHRRQPLWTGCVRLVSSACKVVNFHNRVRRARIPTCLGTQMLLAAAHAQGVNIVLTFLW